jgi:hypothetical protein
MSEQSSAISLAEVLRAANELVAAGLIEDYASAARWRLFTTSSPSQHTMRTSSSSPKKNVSPPLFLRFYSYLQGRGWRVERE